MATASDAGKVSSSASSSCRSSLRCFSETDAAVAAWTGFSSCFMGKLPSILQRLAPRSGSAPAKPFSFRIAGTPTHLRLCARLCGKVRNFQRSSLGIATARGDWPHERQAARKALAARSARHAHRDYATLRLGAADWIAASSPGHFPMDPLSPSDRGFC